MILYTENLKTALKNLELLSEFGKFARPMINIQKSVAFLYIICSIASLTFSSSVPAHVPYAQTPTLSE